MPSEWNYHADGVGTAVQTRHDLDGRLKSVTVQLDAFKVRSWTEDEVEDNPNAPNNLFYDERDEVYEQHADGAHATMKFSVTDGQAELSSIKPEDGDTVEPRHMMLLRGAERVLEQLSEVDRVGGTIEALEGEYDEASAIYIDALDA